MVKYYLRNYKGFESSLVSLDATTFLVGENSTGKTSLLNVLNLFGNLNFWYSFESQLDDSVFGSFEDLKTRNSSSDSFSLGYFTSSEDSREPDYNGVVIKFINSGGYPRPKDIFVVGNKSLVLVRSEGSELYSLYRDYSLRISATNFDDWCLAWVAQFENYKFKLSAFSKLDEDLFSSPLLTAQSHARKVLKDHGAPQFQFTRMLERSKTIAPIRAKPKAVYLSVRGEFSPEGDHTPLLFKTLQQHDHDRLVRGAIEKFGQNSGLFDSIEISRFGLRSNSPFEIDVVKDGKRYNISSIGYGVSQIFPIIVELVTSTNATFFTIQQPEVHLHPRAQASFGELIHELVETRHHTFVLETHSDFIIDRFRLAMRNSSAEVKAPAKILFFVQESGVNMVKDITIEGDGTLSGDGVDLFRSFFIEESIRMLEL